MYQYEFSYMIIYQYCKFLEQSREKISENTCAVTLHAKTEIQNLMQNKYALHDDIDMMYQKKFYLQTRALCPCTLVHCSTGSLTAWAKIKSTMQTSFSIFHYYMGINDSL